MATLHNRVFAQSATADELLDVQEGLLQTFTRIFSLPVPIERVVFVDLIPLSENNFDMAPQTEALENLLGPTFACDVTDTMHIIQQRKDEPTLQAIQLLAEGAVEKLVRRRYVPDLVQNAMKAICFCCNGLNGIPRYRKKYKAFAALRDCMRRMVPIGRCAPDTYLVYRW